VRRVAWMTNDTHRCEGGCYRSDQVSFIMMKLVCMKGYARVVVIFRGGCMAYRCQGGWYRNEVVRG
jgi:hypothetical protein